MPIGQIGDELEKDVSREERDCALWAASGVAVRTE